MSGTRREALLERKTSSITAMRAAASQTPDHETRITAMHAVSLADLVLDILIDIAHPAGGGEPRR